MAGAHLHDGQLGTGADLKDRKGHANLVVQIPFGGTDPVGRAKSRLDKLLGGGFSVGAGEADYRNAKLPAVVCRQGLQGFQGIGHLDQTGVIGLQVLPCHGIRGTFLQSLEGEAVAVEILSLEGKEKLIFLKGTGIRTNSCALQEDIV